MIIKNGLVFTFFFLDWVSQEFLYTIYLVYKNSKTKLETIVTAKTMYSLISFFVAKSPRIVDTGVNTA